MYMKFFVTFLIEKGIIFIRHQAEWMIKLMWNENTKYRNKNKT